MKIVDSPGLLVRHVRMTEQGWHRLARVLGFALSVLDHVSPRRADRLDRWLDEVDAAQKAGQ